MVDFVHLELVSSMLDGIDIMVSNYTKAIQGNAPDLCCNLSACLSSYALAFIR